MKETNKLKGQVLSGLFWKFGERIIAQGVSFVLSLILARLLLPEQYGTVSLLLVFINLANVFVSDGLGAALIQKKEADESDFSTMFFCSISLGILLYLLLFLCAPAIAAFYEQPELINIIRVLALQIPLAAVRTIQHSYVSRHMMFKKFFFSTLGGTLFSGLLGIMMAYKGLGVWALVAQYLANNLIGTIVLFITVPWRPRIMFDASAGKEMIGYSWKLLAASFINVLYQNMRNLVIGKVYSEADLAYNSKGNHFPSLIISNINTSISAVLFPAMSKVKNDMSNLRGLTRRSMKVASYVIFPLMVGMATIAEPMIKVLLTEKWLPCVPYLRLSCIYWMFQPCLTANDQAIKAMGRSDICLKLEIAKKIIGFSLIAITMNVSVLAVVMSNVVFALISAVINAFPNRKLIQYGFGQQIKDMLPALIMSLIMGVCVYCISLLGLNDVLTLVLQVVVGVVVYISLSYISHNDSFSLIMNLLRGVFGNKLVRR